MDHLQYSVENYYPGLIEKYQNTPLHIFWAGHEAVILFFILSGFVLSLPYHNNIKIGYKDYIIKRVCRIYIPYLASIFLSILCINVFLNIGITQKGAWFNDTWSHAPSVKNIVNHLIFLGDYSPINGVIWSLVHEMRISLIFPFLMIYMVFKYNWKRNVAIAIAGSLVYFFIYFICMKTIKYDMSKSLFNYFSTLHYIAFFVVGALLAKYKHSISNVYGKLNKITKCLLIIAGFLFYLYSQLILPNKSILHLVVIDDWMIAIGCAIFVIFALNSTVLKNTLLLKPIRFAGKISYSLYLFHMTVLLALLNTFIGRIPTWSILTMIFVISIIFASLMYYLVEKPSIKLGKYLTKSKSIKPTKNKEASA